jgi:hypothetical protein
MKKIKQKDKKEKAKQENGKLSLAVLPLWEVVYVVRPPIISRERGEGSGWCCKAIP